MIKFRKYNHLLINNKMYFYKNLNNNNRAQREL